MRLLITGALGHIGSRLIRDLPHALPGVEVVIVDDLSSQRYCSLFDLPPEGRYRFIEADVVTTDLLPILRGVDAVVHLAAITDAAHSFEIAERVRRVNLGGSANVARACAEVGCGLIFLSTTSVYGTQSEIVDEACPVADLRPQSPYAEAKLEAERLLAQLGDAKGLRFITCRFGTIFGTSIGMRFHTAINKFCWQAVMGQPITVWKTSLQQKRPYLDLGDAVRALLFVLRTGRCDNEIYNVVTANATVSEIVDMIRARIPETTVELVDSPIMNQLSYHVSAAKFEALGFEFLGSLQQGIVDTIALLGRASGISAPGGEPAGLSAVLPGPPARLHP